MKIINLLPPEEQKQLEFDRTNHQLRTFWVIVFLSLIVFVGLGFATQQYLKISIRKIDDQIQANKITLESSDIKKLQEQVTTLNQNIKEVKNIRSQQYKWSEVLLEIAKIMPGDAQLNSFQADRITGKIVVLGKAKNRDTVIETWSELKKSKLFKDVDFPLPNLEQPTDSNFSYTFFVNLEMIKNDPAN